MKLETQQCRRKGRQGGNRREKVAISKRTKVSPPELAARWGVSPDKVLGWIRSGELRAINVARNRHTRPRYLIDQADIVAFELSRQVHPDLPTARVRRSNNTEESITKYF
jgi:hypothetical protein